MRIAVAGLVEKLTDHAVIDLTLAIVNVVMSIFGGETQRKLPVAMNWLTLLATSLISIWMLHRKLRAHEVVE